MLRPDPDLPPGWMECRVNGIIRSHPWSSLDKHFPSIAPVGPDWENIRRPVIEEPGSPHWQVATLFPEILLV